MSESDSSDGRIGLAVGCVAGLIYAACIAGMTTLIVLAFR